MTTISKTIYTITSLPRHGMQKPADSIRTDRNIIRLTTGISMATVKVSGKATMRTTYMAISNRPATSNGTSPYDPTVIHLYIQGVGHEYWAIDQLSPFKFSSYVTTYDPYHYPDAEYSYQTLTPSPTDIILIKTDAVQVPSKPGRRLRLFVIYFLKE